MMLQELGPQVSAQGQESGALLSPGTDPAHGHWPGGREHPGLQAWGGLVTEGCSRLHRAGGRPRVRTSLTYGAAGDLSLKGNHRNFCKIMWEGLNLELLSSKGTFRERKDKLQRQGDVFHTINKGCVSG